MTKQNKDPYRVYKKRSTSDNTSYAFGRVRVRRIEKHNFPVVYSIEFSGSAEEEENMMRMGCVMMTPGEADFVSEVICRWRTEFNDETKSRK